MTSTSRCGIRASRRQRRPTLSARAPGATRSARSGAGADAGVGAGTDPGGAAASSSLASSAASSTKKRTRAIKFDKSYVPDAPQNQQAEGFMRDANGYALDATGARLALQPPDVSLRVAKKLGLQDPAVSALDRYTRLKIVQALPSDPANASAPFWCNACSSVLTASRAKSGGAVQASAILRHLRSKHNLYLRAARRPDGAPQPPHCAQGEPLPADGLQRGARVKRGAARRRRRRGGGDGLRLLRHRRRNAELSTKSLTWTRTSAGSAAQARSRSMECTK